MKKGEKMSDEEIAKRKAAKDAKAEVDPPKSIKTEEMPQGAFQQSVLGILQQMQNSQNALKQEIKDQQLQIDRMSGKPIKAPVDFEPQNDEAVPAAASAAVRKILGNKVVLRALEAPNQPGFFLEITVPDALHTIPQMQGFRQQRELIRKDPNTGKVIERTMEDWIQPDVRTRYIPQFGMVENAIKYAEAVADNINREFAKVKMPQVNFFD